MRMKMMLTVLVGMAAVTTASAQTPAKIDPSIVQKYVGATFKGAPADWQARIVQDETQKLCSEYRNELPVNLAKAVIEREKATVVYPADGNVLGDWKRGAKLAQLGRGGQFSDKPDGPKGGNCYACHQLDPAELSYGTLGPSLLEYGKARKFKAEEAKAAYAKIYNAQAVQPCSNMPRFGHNKFLSEQDMKDLTAYLFDPASPVNK